MEAMKALLHSECYLVMATVRDGNPHCSLMAYTCNDDCTRVFMVTHRGTAKYANLLGNPRVSLLVDTRQSSEAKREGGKGQATALTLHGAFSAVEEQQAKSAVISRMLESHPDMRGFLEHPDAEVISVAISSFLYIDGASKTPQVFLV